MFRRDDRPKKRLPEDLEDLARGDADRVRPPPRRPRIQDERPIALVPGVANRDARAVFDARLVRLEQDRAGYPDDADARDRLAEGLREAAELRLWRGRSLTGFDALAEQLLSLPSSEAREISGPPRDLTDEAIAIWIRAEAALLSVRIEARVRIVVDGTTERLSIELGVNDAPEGSRALAQGLGPLRADLRRW